MSRRAKPGTTRGTLEVQTESNFGLLFNFLFHHRPDFNFIYQYYISHFLEMASKSAQRRQRRNHAKAKSDSEEELLRQAKRVVDQKVQLAQQYGGPSGASGVRRVSLYAV